MLSKFFKIMTSKKALPVVLIIIFGSIFWAFSSRGDNGDVLVKQQLLLNTVGAILEQKHYSPKKIDDNFSKNIFKKYLEDIDPDKDMLLQQDIDALMKYETSIDDEIHGAPLQFFPAVMPVYLQRMKEASAIYTEILSKPFDFTVSETVQLDADLLNFPSSAAERKETWRKRLKYLTLERFADLRAQRDKSKSTDSIHQKTDVMLEKEARERVAKIMKRSFDRLAKTYNEDEQFSLFVNTITEAMDPHSTYFPPIEKRAFDEDMSGRFYGIGAQLKEEDGAIKIASLITGSPAWKSKQVQVNDIIMKVGQGTQEPIDITGYATTDAVKIIRGTKGTEVRLTLKKEDGTLQTVSIIRDEIVQDESFARSAVVNSGGKKIGYIFLPEFYADFERPNGARSSADVAGEIKKLKNERVDGIVLDLRNNGGGSLFEVVQMAGLFIKSGPIVQVKDKEGKPAILNDDNDAVLYDGPLAVMVNELSASASEIFAAAIQDYKRGIIIGSTSTFGKGTVQKNLPLGKPLDFLTGATEYGALKLTFEKFYRINGGSTQLRGVTPDIVIPDVYEYLKFREKDNPSALSWDQIPKSDYTVWNSNIDWKQVEANAQKRISGNPLFETIKKNTDWLKENIDKEYNLNINKYKAEQQLIKNTVTQTDSVSKLSKEMDLKPLSVDEYKFYDNPDKAKGERYQQWLKSLRSDLYVDETVNIVSDMINSSGSNVVRH